MLQTSNHLQTNPTITIIQTKYLGFLIPVKSFSQQREKQFIVLFKVARQLLQQIFGHSRFWSPFTGTETFVPGNIIFHSHRPDQRGEESCSPDTLQVSSDNFLFGAVEPLRLVEVEVVLRQLLAEAEESLEVAKLNPRRGDELISIYHVDLLSREDLKPPEIHMRITRIIKSERPESYLPFHVDVVPGPHHWRILGVNITLLGKN